MVLYKWATSVIAFSIVTSGSTYGQFLPLPPNPGNFGFPGQQVPKEKGPGCSLANAGQNGIDAQQLRTNLDGQPELDHQIRWFARMFNDIYQVNPDFLYLEDGDRPNAYAAEVSPLIPGSKDGAIFFGKQFIERLTRTPPTWPAGRANPAILVFVGHEFSHIKQFQRLDRLQKEQKELAADYMAGWGIKQLLGRVQFGDFATSDVVNAMHRFGDYQYRQDQHHGIPRERAFACMSGIDDTSIDARHCYLKSVDFVASMAILQFEPTITIPDMNTSVCGPSVRHGLPLKPRYHAALLRDFYLNKGISERQALKAAVGQDRACNLNWVSIATNPIATEQYQEAADALLGVIKEDENYPAERK